MESPSHRGTAANRSTCLGNLPVELQQAVCTELTTRDVKNIRLTCKAFQHAFPLPLNRVFLSPNSRNIQVFEDIARHDTFRHQIVEIIYDDARLRPSSDETAKQRVEDPDESADKITESPSSEAPFHYRMAYRELVDSLRHWRPRDVKRPYHLARTAQFEQRFSVERSYELYQDLLQDEDRTIAAGRDGEALRYGLSRFPNLRRITLTPAAHGIDLRPLYRTPMIRELPHGFIYPIPKAWPQMPVEPAKPPVLGPWQSEEEKDKWRGFRLVTRTLAQSIQQNQVAPVTEFVVDTNHLLTGLSWAIFGEPNDEYDNLVSILRQPGFSRVDLSLLFGKQERGNWHGHALRTDLLRQALIQAPDLEHVSLSTNFDHWYEFGLGDFIRLSTIFPVDNWPRLRHFGLSRFLVEHSDLFALLAALPPTLRSIELSQLHFRGPRGTYQEFFEEIRNKLGWRERPAGQRPSITVRLGKGYPFSPIRVSIVREIEDYVYGEGLNPFEGNPSPCNPATIGIGTEIDLCEPGHERPYAGLTELVRLGFETESRLVVDYHQQLQMLEEQHADRLALARQEQD